MHSHSDKDKLTVDIRFINRARSIVFFFSFSCSFSFSLSRRSFKKNDDCSFSMHLVKSAILL